MKTINHYFFTLTILFSSFHLSSQVVGGRANGEMSPKIAEPTTLSGGTFSGDVNIMTGEYKASIPLGTVATPGGISYSLSLDHSSSFSFSFNQPTSSGIPYGDGWNLSIPTISVETDLFHAYDFALECQNNNPCDAFGNTTSYEDSEYGKWEGDLMWYSPSVNIPGVGGGKAVFKYIDEKDADCAVFVLNSFESPIEIRFYGYKWEVRLADGTVYNFENKITTYRAPSNSRIFDYSCATDTYDYNNAAKALVEAPQDFDFGLAIKRVIEPIEDFGTWYCSSISNRNIPLQVIRFEYEGYGKFNFYKEFEQENYKYVYLEVYKSVTIPSYLPDYSFYKDILLKSVTSYTLDSPLDVLELDYKTLTSGINPQIILDPITNTRIDSLYTSKVVWSSNDSFSNWKRFKHSNRDGDYWGNINPSNPYLTGNNYLVEPNNDIDQTELKFDHSFLESPRIPKEVLVGIGDVYEIKTRIVRPNSQSLINGNGTIDIAIVSANQPISSSNPGLTQTSGPISLNDYNSTRGTKVFSTFNMGMKWQMGYGENVLETSNSFIMPNLREDFEGINIQVGPGNSDIDYNYSFIQGLRKNFISPQLLHDDPNNALAAYPQLTAYTSIKPFGSIPHNFGIGLPWGMTAPVFNSMGLVNNILNPSAADHHLLYKGTWSLPLLTNGTLDENHNPTKFDETISLTEVELIRYSKNAYMLQGVRQYKINGEYGDNYMSGKKLVAQKRLKYSTEYARTVKDNGYQNGDPLQYNSPTLNRLIVLLKEVVEVPLEGELYTLNYSLPANTKALTTYLEYENILPEGALNYDNDKPYLGLTHYSLTKFTDHLGGITGIDYYPILNQPTRIFENIVIQQNCDALNVPPTPFGRSITYTMFPAVETIGKSVVNYDINGETDFSPVREWKYVYNLNAKIYNKSQLELPSRHFRNQRALHIDMAFGEVTVYSPVLDDGSRNYKVYEYFGAPLQGAISLVTFPEIENYLLYGKLKSVTSYSETGIKHDETFYNYDYTLAYEDGYKRPNYIRDRVTIRTDDAVLFTRDYEYKDYYRNDVMQAVDYTNNQTVFGEDAKRLLIPNHFSGEGSLVQKPSYLPFLLNNELRYYEGEVLNPDYLFNAYFIKKVSEINRVYEDGLSKAGAGVNPVLPPSKKIFKNPMGEMPLNEVANSTNDLSIINNINNLLDLSIPNLLAIGQLSDTVLIQLLGNKKIKSEKRTDVLVQQGGLSPMVWKEIINRFSILTPKDLERLVASQPHFDDEVQRYLLTKVNQRMDPVFFEKLLVKNPELSDSMKINIIETTAVLPLESFKTIFNNQKYQFTEEVLNKLVKSPKINNSNVVELFQRQGLTEQHYIDLVKLPTVNDQKLVEVIENAEFSISEVVLQTILTERNVPKPLMEEILNTIEYEISSGTELLLTNKYPNINRAISDYNNLSKYCTNQVNTNRIYIETKKEFEYYEATHEGFAIGKPYEVLMGLISSTDEPSSFPKTASYELSPGFAVNRLQLKHEPSWQLFSVTTSSPHLPTAYSKEEYFYLFDLRNRYDRIWYNYDLDENASLSPYIQDVWIDNIQYKDTFVVNFDWDTDYQSTNTPNLPEFDGLKRTLLAGNKVLAFQKSTFSKNTRDAASIRRSEYYEYDARWIINDLQLNGGTMVIEGEPCPPPPLFECEECMYYNHIFSEEALNELVESNPGWCAWEAFPNGGYEYDFWLCPENVTASNCYDVGRKVCYSTDLAPDIKFLNTGLLLSSTLNLRSVHVQVDTLDVLKNSTFDVYKMDTKNKYIAEFELSNLTDFDENNFKGVYKMILPFTNLTVRTIDERNRFLQPALEHNQVNLKTKYYYDRSVKYQLLNPLCTIENYTMSVNTNIGLPTRITVGFQRNDSLSTTYEYNDVGMITKVTEPSGKFSEYTFDGYNRLTGTSQNGERILANYNYHMWEQDENTSFFERTQENYVHSTIYNSAELNDFERRRAYMDPQGRTQGVITSYVVGDSVHHIYSGTAVYDNWDRVFRAHKNYVKSYDLTELPDAITPTLQFNYTNPYSDSKYENTPKNRVVKAANFGVALNDPQNHTVRSLFSITNNIYASCELGLSRTELIGMMGNGNTNNYRFFRTEILDQDNKRSIEYTNALGQKVATLKFANNGVKVVTLFSYDSYGNLTKVINPEKQVQTYEYNILGQLVRERTVDAGERKYMYNMQGMVSVALDQQGFKHLNTQNEKAPFYRVFSYDIYGKLLSVGRSNGPTNYLDFATYGPLHYKNEQLHDATDPTLPDGHDSNESGDWEFFRYTYSNASSQDWLAKYAVLVVVPENGYESYTINTISISAGSTFAPFALEKQLVYGNNTNPLHVGKLIESASFDNAGAKIQKTLNSYDNYDQLTQQIIYFNPDQVVGVPETFSQAPSIIEYTGYNYRGSLLEQKVDVNGDNSPDIHYFYEYDALNRMKNIYAASQEVATRQDATLLVSYEHNDAVGVIKKKTHQVSNGAVDVPIIETIYSYDVRDRLTDIVAKNRGFDDDAQAPLMRYHLPYDNYLLNADAQSYFGTNINHSTNWNGNINGSFMFYNFDKALNQPQNFDKPLMYGYTYDQLNRLTVADGIVGDFIIEDGTTELVNESHRIGDERYSYDRIGNIRTLNRGLKSNEQGEILANEQFTYNYQTATNRLLGVIGQAETPSRTYSYDDNGNLLTDSYRNVDATEYGRAAYAYHITQDDKEISYFYSVDDQRMFKKISSPTETKREYYLSDAMGRVVALRSEITLAGQIIPTTTWEYYINGSEREARLINQDSDPKFGTGEVNFFLYDHLGNTRLNYTPVILQTPESVTPIIDDQFNAPSIDGWSAFNSNTVVSNYFGNLKVENTNAVPVCVKQMTVNHTTYQIELDVQFDTGTIPSMSVSIGTDVFALNNGINIFTSQQLGMGVVDIKVGADSGTGSFTMRYIKVGEVVPASEEITYTVNFVADYFPYGKIVREYVNNGGQERYLTTQHERDQETGLDYRGARYYDSDVARFLSLDPHASDYSSWSPYNYVFGNPIHYVDLDGKDGVPAAVAFTNGLNNAIFSNVAFGYGRELAAEAYPDDLYAQRDFLYGQIAGDIASMIAGGVTMDASVAGLGASGVIALTGVGIPVSVGVGVVSALGLTVGIAAITYANVGMHSSLTQLNAVNGEIDAQKNANSGGNNTSQKSKNLADSKSKGVPESQIGPSGKPKIHTVEKSTMKGAKDAARNNPKSNSSPQKHTSDKGQKGHYHSTKNGEKLKGKDNTHYNYPSKTNPK